MRGSGLGVASRGVSVKQSWLERFRARQVGWDRLARKGTLHVRVRVGDVEVDALNAHLQSGYDPAVMGGAAPADSASSRGAWSSSAAPSARS